MGPICLASGAWSYLSTDRVGSTFFMRAEAIAGGANPIFNLIIKRMKKLFLILSMSMLFMACSDDKDDYTGQIPSAISLYVGETQKIEAVGAKSSNEFVASVSNKGEVRAEHVGTARISAGFQRHCYGETQV